MLNSRLNMSHSWRSSLVIHRQSITGFPGPSEAETETETETVADDTLLRLRCITLVHARFSVSCDRSPGGSERDTYAPDRHVETACGIYANIIS